MTSSVVPPDHIIVGAGVFGAALAWSLAAAGRSVLVLERAEIASGASGGPGHRGVRANGRDLRELPLARRALDIWAGLDEALGRESGYRRVGGLSIGEADLTPGRHGRVTLKARAAVQNAYGLRTEILDAEEVRAFLPQVSRKVIWALHNPDDGVADHTRVTRAFAAAARERGAEIREGARVLSARRDAAGRPEVLLEDGSVLTAGRAVIFAANTRVPGLLEKAFGLTLPVWSFNPQVAQVRVGRGLKIDQLVNHAHRTLSIKRADEDHITVTGGALGFWNDETETGTTDLSALSASLAALAATFPEAAANGQVTHLEAARADSATPDHIPVIDQVGDQPFFYATGWSGHGFAIGPAVAEAVAGWLLTGTRPEVLTPFAAARFAPSL